ncbi:helix-turn-helix transcriptional regulator [Shimia sp. R9_2]|uniref:helix-turn-helix domain-containing protein n=1 Tax=Shimia sp. R9_2 TaxID=2821112 RepID=UPI001ADB7286|nr:helix-turn-helix transcriptional regulator [Shimia sp. R9_2]MBO9396458.1 helix-turn-helix transcriptional regulator [Shimia sp. R9_2]
MSGFANVLRRITPSQEGVLNIAEMARAFIGTCLAITWLLVLYAFTIWMVVGSLSTILLHDEFVAAGIEGTFQDIALAEQQVVMQQETIWRQLDEVDHYENLEFNANQRSANFATSDDWVSYIDFHSATSPQSIDYYASLALWEFVETDLFHMAQAECQRDGKDANSITNRFCREIENLDEQNDRLYGMRLDIETSDLMAYRENLYKKATTIRNEHPLSQHITAVGFFYRWGYTYLIYLPRPVMVMVLTMSMGILGSVITMTWKLLGSDKLSIRSLAMLPLVGCMSAFVILVFAKAGQITLSTGIDPGSLNPFFISFLGIISGLLSESAYARMAQIGHRFFEASDDITRWGIGLDAIAQSEGLSPDDLSSILGIHPSDLQNILSGESPATPEHQTLIAAALRRPVETLFTDLRPHPNQEVEPPAPLQNGNLVSDQSYTKVLQALLDNGEKDLEALAAELEAQTGELSDVLSGNAAVPEGWKPIIQKFAQNTPTDPATNAND